MEYKKKADRNSKPIKYLNNRMQGQTKKQAEENAGYTSQNHSSRIEETKTYKEGLLKLLLPEDEVAKEHNKNIKQDKDRGAKNKAIDMYYKLENKYPKEQGELEVGDLKITIKQETP